MNLPGASRRSRLSLALAITLAVLLTAAALFTVTRPRAREQPWPLHIAVVGGTYTAGAQNRVVWPTLLAERTGWAVSNFALPEAGFVADGTGGHAFTYQVDRAQAAHPQIIMIVADQGDNNQADMGGVRIGAIDAVNKIQLGGQRALLVGPTWYDTPVPENVQRLSATIQRIAETAGIPFLDALDPPWLTKDLMSGPLTGPNDAGQSAMADRIAAWLRTEVAE